MFKTIKIFCKLKIVCKMKDEKEQSIPKKDRRIKWEKF